MPRAHWQLQNNLPVVEVILIGQRHFSLVALL